MRLMRWAAELAVDEDLDLVEAVAHSLLDDPVAEYDQDAAAGDDDDVAYADEPWAPDVDR